MSTCGACGKEFEGDFAFCPFCGAPLVARSAREVRKVVTVLFCDVTGSTELGERLDPEALRAVLARYFERMKAIVERHGGSVEKFIGDAVMAVFGVPVVHEDDALRALRAAIEMRDALPELGIEGRLGVMTGEVVTGTAERLATGDAVNVAARLEQAAQPGEILIGAETLRLTRHAIDVEPVPPLDVKGKTQPLEAYRLLAAHGDEGFARSLDTPLVGRETELRRLRDAHDQSVADPSCQVFTILGAAGVGKSRLAAEFLGSLGGTTRIVRGRCLPYGEGITYWPVIEVVKQMPEADLDAATRQGISALLGEERPITKEEIARAFRKLLEVVASQAPLVCVFDDVHWGEPTFLDLIEHVADLSRDVPIFMLCIARPELLELRPGWGGGKVNSTTVLLEPLGVDEAAAMIASLAVLDDNVRTRILDAAEGNPLFVEQMVALVSDAADGAISVPPTIQALLVARLEQLDESERVVLERGAIEGRIFHQGAVQALAPEEPQVATRLTSLVRKELVRPDKPLLAGEDAYRFRHVLIRDAAYDSLPKATRADLHVRFASWLDDNGSDLVELEELLGYHLEQAYLCRIDLGPVDDETSALAQQAGHWLGKAGRRAYERADMPAAANLLERAEGLTPRDDPERLRQQLTLARAYAEIGALEKAIATVSEIEAHATASGDPGLAAEARVDLANLRLHTTAELSHHEIEEIVDTAVDALEMARNDEGLSRALRLGGSLAYWRGETELGIERSTRALAVARKAGLRADELEAASQVLVAMIDGPTPIATAAAWADDLARLTSGSSAADARRLRDIASLEAMLGNLDHARDLALEAARLADELGLVILRAIGVGRVIGEIELLAGNAAAAEVELRSGCDVLERAGDWGHLVSLLPFLAEALLELDRGEEVFGKVQEAAERVVDDDLDGRIGLARVRARLLAARGDPQATEVAREAATLVEATEYVRLRSRVALDVADILPGADATRMLGDALHGCELKGAVGLLLPLRAKLDALQQLR